MIKNIEAVLRVSLTALLFSFPINLIGQWTQSSKTFAKPLRTIVSDGTVVLAGADGIYRSTNDGVDWSQLTTVGAFGSVPYLMVDDNLVYAYKAETTKSTLSVSSDHGDSWKILPHIISVPPTAMQRVGSRMYGAQEIGKVIVSDDSCYSWTDISNDNAVGSITSLAAQDSLIYVGFREWGVYRTTNAGTHWTAQNKGMNLYVNHLYLHDSRLYCATGDGLLVSDDSAQTWKAVYKNTSDPAVGDFLFYGTQLLLSTGNGKILRSSDGGVTWIDISEGYTGGVVNQFALHHGTLFVAGSDKTVWKRKLSEMISGVDENSIDKNDELTVGTPFPNPAANEVSISFTLGYATTVRVLISDVLGCVVASREYRNQNPGDVVVHFDSAQWAHGIYSIKVVSTYGVITRCAVVGQ